MSKIKEEDLKFLEVEDIYSDGWADIIKDLENYCHLENTEIGETGMSLCIIAKHQTSYVSKEFLVYLVREIKSHLLNFKLNCKVVKKSYTPPTQKKPHLQSTFQTQHQI